MLEMLTTTTEIILAFSGGILIGSIAGWFARKYVKKTKVKETRAKRMVFGTLIMLVWTASAFAAIFAGFEIPIYFHVFAGLVCVPIFDPSGNTIDNITGLFSKK